MWLTLDTRSRVPGGGGGGEGGGGWEGDGGRGRSPGGRLQIFAM